MARFAEGRPYVRELASSSSYCRAAGLEHAEVLDEAMRRSGLDPAGNATAAD